MPTPEVKFGAVMLVALATVMPVVLESIAATSVVEAKAMSSSSARHAGSKLRVKGCPAVQNINTGWEPVGVDVVSPDKAHREAQLLVGNSSGHIDSAWQRQVRRAKSKSILVECQCLRRRSVGQAKRVDRCAVCRRGDYVLERACRDNRRRDWDRSIARAVRVHVGGNHKLSQSSRGLLVLRVDCESSGGA